MNIKLGIIGAGEHFYKKILPAVKKIRNVEIISILTRKKVNRSNIYFSSEKEFFKNNLDFVYISVPSRLHYKYIIKSLKHKVNVICEKPFCTNMKDFKKIKKLASENKKIIFEAFAYRFHPVFSAVQRLIKSKIFGTIEYVNSSFTIPSINKKNNRYNREIGGGFFLDLGVYLLSVENFLINRKINTNQIIKKTIKLKKLELKGFLNISSKFRRFYFWGGGMNYSNYLQINFKKASIYVNKFFSKDSSECIYLNIHSGHTEKKIKFHPIDQFLIMFKYIFKNYDDKKFIQKETNNIEKQIKLLKKFNYEV